MPLREYRIEHSDGHHLLICPEPSENLRAKGNCRKGGAHLLIKEKFMRRQFQLDYWIDDGWYVVKLRGIPGVFSQGETLEELELNIREAYRLMFAESSYPSSSRD